MAFVRSSLKVLRDRAISIANSTIEGIDALLPVSVMRVLCYVVAEMTNELYGYIDYLAKQLFVTTAEGNYLNTHGTLWGIFRKMASFSTGNLIIVGSVGSPLSQGTKFKRGDGMIFISTTSVIIPIDGFIKVPVISEKVGYNTNSNAGTKFSLFSPLNGINSDVLVDTNGLTGGTEREEDESYRERILLRIQNPPHGGSKSDYESWALQVQGVTRAWCYPTEQGLGTVVVRFMMDNTYPNGIPQEGDIQRVYDYINDPKRIPATAQLFVVAPLPKSINITLTSLSPNNEETQQSIKNELKAFFSRESYPGSVIYSSRLWEAVSTTGGVNNYQPVSPIENIIVEPFEISLLGDVNFSKGI